MEPGDNRAMIHDELQRLLENNAIALLSARNPNNEEGPHQPRRSFGSVAEERSNIFQPRGRGAMRGRGGTGRGTTVTSSNGSCFGSSVPSSSFSTTRSYRPTMTRPQTSRRGGSRGRRPSPYSAAPQSKASLPPQFVTKEVFMIDFGSTDAPRGAKRAALYENKQVKSGVQLNPRWTAQEFKDAIEREFNEILDMSMEHPRFEVIKYINGHLVKPSLSNGQEWSCANILANCKQGDVYLRSCHPLLLMAENENGQHSILQYCAYPENQVMEEQVDGVAETECSLVEEASMSHPQQIFAKLCEIFPDAEPKLLEEAAKKETMIAATEFILQSGSPAAVDDDDDESDIDDNVTLREAALAVSSREEKTLQEHLDVQRIFSDSQVINVDRANILHNCIRLLKQKRLQLRVPPEIKFDGEDGIDANGLTREFSTILLAAIREGESNVTLFEGEFPHLVPVHSTDALSSKLFFYVGQLFAYCLAHSMIGIVGISPAVTSYIIYGCLEKACELLTLSDVADLQLRDMLQRLTKAETDSDINSLTAEDEFANVLSNSGFQEMLVFSNRHKAIQFIMLNDVILKRKSEIEDIRKGLDEPFGVVTYLKKNVNGGLLDLFPTTSSVQLFANDIIQKLCPIELSTEKHQTILSWFRQYIVEISTNKDSDEVNLQKLMMFINGSPLLPKERIKVTFNDSGKSLPDADCCFTTIELPTIHNAYGEFQKSMHVTISCQYRGTGRF